MIADRSESRAASIPAGVLAAAGVIAFVQVLLFHGVRRDDAFISYRYGQNLSRGLGLVFNPGEHVMGSTSPGHVLLSALVHRIVGDQLLPSVMSALGCVGWTAQALALGVLVRRALPARAAWTIALAVALGAGRAQEHLPLETTIVAALISWSLVFALSERWYLATALGALAVLFRPDMYLPVGLIAGLCLWRMRAIVAPPASAGATPPKAVRLVLLFVAIVTPWYAFAYAYYGTLLPQSASAKFHRRELAEYALFELRTNGALGLPFAHPLFVDVLACGLSVFGAFVLVRRAPQLWVLPAWVVMHDAAYLWLRPFTHAWHLYPVASLSAVLLLCGLYRAGEALAGKHAALALAPIALLCVAYGVTAAGFARDHEHAAAHGARDSVHRAVARFLSVHARPSDLVATVEVGTVAYYSNLTMYDWGGLITPHVVFRPTDRRINWALVDHSTPELGVSQAPVKTFVDNAFWVKVYNFELLELAARRVAATTGPGFRLHRLKQDLRPAYEQQLRELAQALDASGMRIDTLIAARTPR